MRVSCTPSCVRKVVLLCGCLALLFSQFAVLALPAPFLAISDVGAAIGGSVGFVFSAFPLGTVLAAPLPPLLLRKLGARPTICLGLSLAATAQLGLGLLPALLLPHPNALAIALMGCRFIGGVAAALAETVTFVTISLTDFGNMMGVVMSLVQVVIGAGISFGMLIGGLLYEAGGFKLPFLCAACAPLLLLVLMMVVLPRVEGDDEAGEGSASGPSAWTFARLAALGSIVLWNFCNEGLFPVLGPHLKETLGDGPASVGRLFALNEIFYVLLAMPVGYLIDNTGARPKMLMGLGWLGMCVGYICLGPLNAVAPLPLTTLAMGCLGTAAAFVIVPTMPDLTTDLPDRHKPVVGSAFQTAFSLGALIGPTTVGALTRATTFGVTAVCYVVLTAVFAVTMLTLHAFAEKARVAKERALATPSLKAVLLVAKFKAKVSKRGATSAHAQLALGRLSARLSSLPRKSQAVFQAGNDSKEEEEEQEEERYQAMP